MQGGPGVEGRLGVGVADAADLGVVPALGVVEVLLADHGLVVDDHNVVGDVQQRRLRDGPGVEVPQLLDVGDVEALEGLPDGAPGGVAGLGLGVGLDAQGGVDALADALGPGVQEGQDKGDPHGAGQRVGVAVLAQQGGEHGGADGVAGGHCGGRALLVQADGLGVDLRGQPLDLGQRVVAVLVGGRAASGERARGCQGRERREGPQGAAPREEVRAARGVGRAAGALGAGRRAHEHSVRWSRGRCQEDDGGVLPLAPRIGMCIRRQRAVERACGRRRPR